MRWMSHGHRHEYMKVEDEPEHECLIFTINDGIGCMDLALDEDDARDLHAAIGEWLNDGSGIGALQSPFRSEVMIRKCTVCSCLFLATESSRCGRCANEMDI